MRIKDGAPKGSDCSGDVGVGLVIIRHLGLVLLVVFDINQRAGAPQPIQGSLISLLEIQDLGKERKRVYNRY